MSGFGMFSAIRTKETTVDGLRIARGEAQRQRISRVKVVRFLRI